MFSVKIGATQTGGTTVNLTANGVIAAGQVSYVTPSNTYLTPEVVTLSVKAPVRTASEPGVARTGVKIRFAALESEAGDCCTLKGGDVGVDLGFRWNLVQTEATVDKVIDYLRGIIYAPEFVSAVKKGLLPA